MNKDILKRFCSAIMSGILMFYPISSLPIMATEDTTEEVDEDQTNTDESETIVEEETAETSDTFEDEVQEDDSVVIESKVTLTDEIESENVSFDVSKNSSDVDDVIKKIQEDDKNSTYNSDKSFMIDVAFEKDGEAISLSDNKATLSVDFKDKQIEDILDGESEDDLVVYRVDLSENEPTVEKLDSDAKVTSDSLEVEEENEFVSYLITLPEEKKSSDSESKSKSTDNSSKTDSTSDEKTTDENKLEDTDTNSDGADEEYNDSAFDTAEEGSDEADKLEEETKEEGTLKIKLSTSGLAEGTKTSTKFRVTGDTTDQVYTQSEASEGITLEVGTYKITQEDYAVDGYTISSSTGPQTIDLTTKGNTVEFSTKYKKVSNKGTLKVNVESSGIKTSKLSNVLFTVTGPDNYSKTYHYVDLKDGISSTVAAGNYSISVSNQDIDGYNVSVSTSDTVSVSKDSSGTLNVSLAYEHKVGTLIISNQYESESDSSGEDYEYTVQIGSKTKTYTIKSGESIAIDNIDTGTYYSVVEKNNDENVTVLANGVETNVFTGTIVEGDNAITFVNKPSDVKNLIAVLRANVTIDNETPSDDAYTFVLKDEKGNVVQTQKNTKGKITFDPITFSKEGTYVYTISQVTKSSSSNTSAVTKSKGLFDVYAAETTVINLDSSVYKETITVVEKDGKLTASAKITKNDKEYDGVPTFKNVTKSSTPDTSTQTNIVQYAVIGLIAAAAIVVLVLRNRKK